MKLIIDKNRKVYSAGTWGTKNENNYEILNFEFPEELEEYNKRIVYYLGNQKVWDAIIDNKAILTNAITTKGSVKAYVWCTKSDEAFETDVDFRTQIFVMNFFENDNADGIVPTPEQVDGFNTMLTAMNEKIDEVDALEQTIETAEAQRQEAEATRVSNENTRESNESTRESNEQTRQTQEADRERRTDEAISNIQDKTAEYNANAEEKTNEFNDLVHAQELAIENYGDTQLNAIGKKGQQALSSITTTTRFALQDISLAQQTGVSAVETASSEAITNFNTNATNKTNAFNNNATEKTSEFNSNAESKTSAFNDNATQKTTNFDNNASEKTDEFNTNAQNKIDEYDEHIADYQAQIDELQEEVDELSENMPWNTTEQATEISVDDAAKYSRNKLELFGNTEQDNTKMTYKCDGTETGDYYLTYNSIDYYFTMPTITEGDILVFDTTDLKLYLADTEITTESTGTGTNLTFISSPNPDYPQDIHVVSGNNTIGVNSVNYCKDSMTSSWNTNGNVTWGKSSDGIITFKTNTSNQNAGIYKPSAWLGNNFANLFNKYSSITVSCEIKSDVNQQVTALKNQRINVTTQWKRISSTYTNTGAIVFYDYSKTMQNIYIKNIQIETGSVMTTYRPYTHTDYSLNLGSLELCKIGDYQDYLYKENENWYKYGNIDKIILNGSESISPEGTKTITQVFNIQNVLKSHGSLRDVGYCNYFINQPGDTEKFSYVSASTTAKNLYIAINKTRASNAEEFKSWLSNHNIIFYYPTTSPLTTQITDETLIAQLDAIYEHLQLVKGTNNISITASDLKPYMELSYMQDLPAKLDNLDSRLALLE